MISSPHRRPISPLPRCHPRPRRSPSGASSRRHRRLRLRRDGGWWPSWPVGRLTVENNPKPPAAAALVFSGRFAAAGRERPAASGNRSRNATTVRRGRVRLRRQAADNERRCPGCSQRLSTVGEAVAATAGPPDAEGWVRVVIPIESVEHAVADCSGSAADIELLEPIALRHRIAETSTVASARNPRLSRCLNDRFQPNKLACVGRGRVWANEWIVRR